MERDSAIPGLLLAAAALLSLTLGAFEVTTFLRKMALWTAPFTAAFAVIALAAHRVKAIAREREEEAEDLAKAPKRKRGSKAARQSL